MARQKFPTMVQGLNTLISPLKGDLSQSPDCSDVMFNHGILEQRFGTEVLDLEPSHVKDSDGTNKTRMSLNFDGTNDFATATMTQVLGTKWTVRAEISFAVAGNAVSGTKTLLNIAAVSFDPVLIRLDGDGTNIQVVVVVKDSAGNTVTLTSTARTPTQWTTQNPFGSARYIRVTRNGALVSLYIGETLEDSDSLASALIPSEVSTGIAVGSEYAIQSTFSQIQVFSNLVVRNTVLDEEDAYWGISWPTDDISETDVLGNWGFLESTGTTVKDFSGYERDMTVSGATWSGAAHTAARGLGIFTHRRRNGDRYHVLASTRRATSSSGAAPSGAVYIWKATQEMTPFYFGGSSSNDDATATLDGFHEFARFQFLSLADELYIANGKQFARCFGGRVATTSYWGITAPAGAPVVTATGAAGLLSTGTYLYAYSYYNQNTGVESGLSPVFSIAVTATNTATVRLWGSLDPQVTHIRVYRSQVNGTTLTLLTSGEVANGTAPSYIDGVADTVIVGNLQAPGADIATNGKLKRLYFQGGPPTAPTCTQVVGGGALSGGVYYYAYSWYSSLTGRESGFSPAGSVTVNALDRISLSNMVLPDQNFGYDSIRVYRVKADMRVWYLRDTFAAQTTYSNDSLADSSLTTDLKEYSLPPKCQFGAVFANRLWTAGDADNPSTLYWSTPGDYQNTPILNAHIANPGAEITALVATTGALYVHFNDNTVYVVPHPGSEVDLSLFMALNMVEASPRGAAVSHWSVQAVPGGIIWLGRDGFYSLSGGGVAHASKQITPSFLNLNRIRGKFACSMYMEDENLYLCWVSRDNNRLGEDCFVLFLDSGAWAIWKLHADAAGILKDANEIPHYCFMVENGVLCRFVVTSDQDGGGTGTLQGTAATVGITRFASIVGRTAPTGGDGGYPIYFRKSDGTIAQRYKLDPVLSVNSDNFYPSYSGLTSGTHTVYFHGIRMKWLTMRSQFGDTRPDKTFTSLFVYHGKESTGGVRVRYATDEGSLASTFGEDFDLSDDMTSQVALQAAGRCLELEFTHDPPAANENVRIVEVEVEGELASDTG